MKFNDQNGCTETEVNKFMGLPYKNKLFFTCKDWNICSSNIIKMKQPFNHEYIQASYEPFGNSRCCRISDIINDL